MNSALRSKLDRIKNALFAGGVGNPVAYIEQLSLLIFLKLLDEEETRREMYGTLAADHPRPLFPGQSSRYRWSEWRFKTGRDLRDFISDEVFPYMASLVREDLLVATYFQDANLEIENPDMLKAVVDEVDSIAFMELGTDVKGDIHEYLLQYLATEEGALVGQFRTPRQIRLMMVEMLDPDVGDNIFDPAAGTGGFLVDAVEHILAKYSEKPREVPIYGDEWLEKRGQDLAEARQQIPNLQTYRKGPGERVPDWRLLEQGVYGIEVSRQMTRIAMMNLVLHGIRNANVKCANTLSELGGLTEEDLKRRYEVILSNPPLAGVLPKESIRKDLPTDSKKSELVFLGLIMEALTIGGRAAVLVPEGLLFGPTSAHVELRRKLVENYDLQAVISLPAGVFKPYVGVKPDVLVFRRPTAEKKDKHAGHVWFAEIKNDGFDPDKIVQGGRPETPDKNDIPGVLAAWADYRQSNFTKPPGVKAGELLPPGSNEPKSWWASVSVLAENDYNLAAGRYKPQVSEKPPEEDPADLIHATLKLERDIADGLEKLLKEVGAVK